MKAAATTFFYDLYAAHQIFSSAYARLAPSVRAGVPESTWVGAHQECDTQDLAYSEATRPTLAGNTAVVNVSLAGAAAGLGSEEASFVYSPASGGTRRRTWPSTRATRRPRPWRHCRASGQCG